MLSWIIFIIVALIVIGLLRQYWQVILGLIIMSHVIYAPIYFIFFETVESLVEDYSMDMVFFDNMMIKGQDSDYEKKVRKYISKTLDEFEDKTDIDLTDSIYDVLDDNKKVKNLKILEKPVDDAGGKAAVIQYTYEGKNYEIPFVGTERAYFKIDSAFVTCLASTHDILLVLAPIYGLNEDQVKFLYSRFTMNIPH